MVVVSRAAGTAGTAALDEVALHVAAGGRSSLPPDLPERCARAVRLADAVGAPVLEALEAARSAAEDAAAGARAVGVASAQGRAVAGVLLCAPLVVTPVLTRIVGVDALAFYTAGIGTVVLLAATALYVLGAVTVRALVRQAGAPGRTASATGSAGRSGLAGLAAGTVAWSLLSPAAAPLVALAVAHLAGRGRSRTAAPGADEAVDLVATALRGAVGVPEALRLAAAELPAFADELRRLAWSLQVAPGVSLPKAVEHTTTRPWGTADPHRHGTGGIPRLAGLLGTAERLGAQVSPLLRRLAVQLRAEELAGRLAAAERLPAQLTFPTALFLLPATVLLIGAPVVHAGWIAAGW